MANNNKVKVFSFKTTKDIYEKNPPEVQMLLPAKIFLQSSWKFFHTDIYMVHTNTQKEDLIETFVLVLLFNIQHATIVQMHTHAY